MIPETVIVACEQLDLGAVKRRLGARTVKLASEEDMAALAPDCERGCLPPLGSLYAMDVLVSPTLTRDELIAFSGGTHTEEIRLSYDDWEELVHPRVMDIAC